MTYYNGSELIPVLVSHGGAYPGRLWNFMLRNSIEPVQITTSGLDAVVLVRNNTLNRRAVNACCAVQWFGAQQSFLFTPDPSPERMFASGFYYDDLTSHPMHCIRPFEVVRAPPSAPSAPLAPSAPSAVPAEEDEVAKKKRAATKIKMATLRWLRRCAGAELMKTARQHRQLEVELKKNTAQAKKNAKKNAKKDRRVAEKAAKAAKQQEANLQKCREEFEQLERERNALLSSYEKLMNEKDNQDAAPSPPLVEATLVKCTHRKTTKLEKRMKKFGQATTTLQLRSFLRDFNPSLDKEVGAILKENKDLRRTCDRVMADNAKAVHKLEKTTNEMSREFEKLKEHGECKEICDALMESTGAKDMKNLKGVLGKLYSIAEEFKIRDSPRPLSALISYTTNLLKLVGSGYNRTNTCPKLFALYNELQKFGEEKGRLVDAIAVFNMAMSNQGCPNISTAAPLVSISRPTSEAPARLPTYCRACRLPVPCEGSIA